jgi:hypothetical protein
LGSGAAIARPDRIQVLYGYLQSPQFAQSMLWNGSDIERVPIRFMAPTTRQYWLNDTYWIVYERFNSQNLLHKTFMGYGVEERPRLSTITGLTCFGIIILSCCIIGLVIFGRKIDKRYGKRFEEMTAGAGRM